MTGRTGYAQLSNGLWLNDKANELLDAACGRTLAKDAFASTTT